MLAPARDAGAQRLPSATFLVASLPSLCIAEDRHSVARRGNEDLLEAIPNDYARPTVHARNLWHSSVAMRDAWSCERRSGGVVEQRKMVLVR